MNLKHLSHFNAKPPRLLQRLLRAIPARRPDEFQTFKKSAFPVSVVPQIQSRGEKNLPAYVALTTGLSQLMGSKGRGAHVLSAETMDKLEATTALALEELGSIEVAAQEVAEAVMAHPQLRQELIEGMFKHHFGAPMPKQVLEVSLRWLDKLATYPAEHQMAYLRFQLLGGEKPQWLDRQDPVPSQLAGIVRVEDFSAPPRTAPTGANTSRVPFFSQGDLRWNKITMGRNRTIGQAGCALSATAMALSAVTGERITPLDLDALHPYSGDSLVWGKVGFRAESFSVKNLEAQLAIGRPVVVGVDYKPGSNGGSNGTDHWVTITGRGMDEQGRVYYTALDPASRKGGEFRFYPGRDGHLRGTSLGKSYTTTRNLRVASGDPVRLKDGREAIAHTSQPLVPGASGLQQVEIAVAPPSIERGPGVSLEQLTSLMPSLAADRARQLLPHLNAAMKEFEIHTPPRVAAFLAQLALESGELRFFQEAGTGAAHEGARELGNEYPGDGVRFKGRGPIQLVGRNHYIAAGNALGLDLVNRPSLAATPEVGFRVAGWLWNNRNLNTLADGTRQGTINFRVTGGWLGMAQREAYRQRAMELLAGGLGEGEIAVGDHTPKGPIVEGEAGAIARSDPYALIGFHSERVGNQHGIEGWALFYLLESTVEDEQTLRSLQAAVSRSPKFKAWCQKQNVETTGNAQALPPLIAYLAENLGALDKRAGGKLDLAQLTGELARGDSTVRQTLTDALFRKLSEVELKMIPGVIRG